MRCCQDIKISINSINFIIILHCVSNIVSLKCISIVEGIDTGKP